MSNADNIKVAIKARPLIQREREQRLAVQWRIQNDTIECLNPLHSNVKFSFDHICDENSTSEDLYEKVTKPIVISAVNGFNGTVFAYGQTSSGKTHTMIGTSDKPGITTLAVREIFGIISKPSERSYLLRVSYIEIYNERIYDLLAKRNELKIQEANGDTTVKCEEKIVNNEKSIMDLLTLGNKERKTAETKMNVQSSRSHAIFTIIIESQLRDETDRAEAAVQLSFLNLVDLAGSERADSAGTIGSRLKEGSHINKSLLSLSLVINKLSEDPEQSKHINYRDSKLTRILQPSLGGNAKTAIICTITPVVLEETNYTLGFAMRAKKIQNKPIVNEVLSEAVMIKRMHKQISGLEKKLNDEREKCKAIEANLFKRRDQIIGGSSQPILRRRRTWATTLNTTTETENGASCAPAPTEALQSVFGHQVEYTEEQFNTILDASFSSVCSMPSTNTPTPMGRKLAAHVGKSLLKTPRSFRRPPLPQPSFEASPVCTIDKNKRIETLEGELEELQQFQMLEVADFNQRLAQKCSEIELLTQQLESLKLFKREKETTESLIESLQADLEDAKAQLKLESEKSHSFASKIKDNEEHIKATELQMKCLEIEMTEAKKKRTLAECNLSSLEFEYEQYKNKSKARERELVEQIDEKSLEKQIKALNAKIVEAANSRQQLEVTYWEAESKLKSALSESSDREQTIKRLNEENAALKCQIDDAQKAVATAAKLQIEYDDLSSQLMDRIQENDDAGKKHQVIVDDLTKQVEELDRKYGEEKTRAEMLSNELTSLRNDLDTERDQTEQLRQDAKILQQRLNELETELSNNQRVEEPDKGIDVLCVTLKNRSDECDRLSAELSVARTRLSQINGELAESLTRQQELSDLHKNAVNEHAIIVASFEETQAQMDQDNSAAVSSLEKEIAELNKQLIVASQQQRSTLTKIEKCRCEELEREKGILDEICDNLRITVQFVVNELAILRHSYTELQMTVAKQELDHLKLQKTMSMNDDELAEEATPNSVFASTMASTTTTANDTLLADCSAVQRDDEKEASTTAALNAKMCELSKTCATHEYNWRRFNECLMNEAATVDIDQLMDKVNQLKVKASEYDRLLQVVLNANASFGSQYENIENAIIESQKKHSETSEQLVQMTNNHEALKEQLNTVQSECQAKLDELSGHIDTIKNEFAAKEAEKEALLHDKSAQIERFEIDLPKLAAELNYVKEQKLALEEQRTRQQAEFDELLLKNEDLSTKLSEAEQKLTKWNRLKEDEMADLLQKIDSMAKTNVNLEAKIVKLDSQLTNSTAQLRSEEEKLERMANDHVQEKKASDASFYKTIDQLKTKIGVFEDEQEVLERDNKALTATVTTQQSRITELQTKMNGISAELTSIKQELAVKVAQCKALESECGEAQRLRESIETMKLNVQSANKKTAEIEKKNGEFTATINKQKADLSQMQKTFSEREKQAKLIADRELQTMRQELTESSSQRRALNEKLEELETKLATALKNQSTILSPRSSNDGTSTNKPTAQQSRKSKRYSTHDDTRRVSGFNASQDVHVQTDPSNELCRCTEFAQKISSLKRDILIKDAQFNSFKTYTGIDAIKRENEQLKTKLSDVSKELAQLNTEHDRVSGKYERAKEKLVEFLNAKHNKPELVSTYTQTIGENGDTATVGSFVYEMNVNKLNEKYQLCKKNYLEQKEKYEKLQIEMAKITKTMETFKGKYEGAKTICVHRQSQIDRLSATEIDLLDKLEKAKTELEVVQSKYDKAKMLIQHRGKEIERLQKVSTVADENKPVNGKK